MISSDLCRHCTLMVYVHTHRLIHIKQKVNKAIFTKKEDKNANIEVTYTYQGQNSVWAWFGAALVGLCLYKDFCPSFTFPVETKAEPSCILDCF